MKAEPFSGVVYVFRSKRSGRLKLLWWDGTGVVLYAKRLEQGAFCWPGWAAELLKPVHARLLERLKASGKLFAEETKYGGARRGRPCWTRGAAAP